MAFVDILALQEALLLVAAVLIGYVGVDVALAMRKNDTAGAKSALKSAAIPLGSVGAVATVLAVVNEITWPLPGSYNIFFTDVYLLFGLTLVVLAVSMATSTKLQYAGLFGFVAFFVVLGTAITAFGIGWAFATAVTVAVGIQAASFACLGMAAGGRAP